MMYKSRGIFVAGEWLIGGGARLQSFDPVTHEVVWQGNAASTDDIGRAVRCGREAVEDWGDRSPEDRIAVVEAFAEIVETHREDLARMISAEVGKPRWEALAEVGTARRKATATIEAFQTRATTLERTSGGSRSITRFRPFGLVAVLGPFNFPFHMPNSHIMPALVAGNAVILKPSELAPGVSEMVVDYWQRAGLPLGVLSLLQGGSDVGRSLAQSQEVDGIFFTGSLDAGLSISECLASTPWRIMALEMGGNSPLVVWDYGDTKAAVYNVLFSAFATAGQRCSSARRLIVNASDEKLVDALCAATEKIRVGHYTMEPEPFMGPVIRRTHAERLIRTQETVESRGGRILIRARLADDTSALVYPGIVDATEAHPREDEETLGPLLQVVRASSFEDAIKEANATKFGLAAGLISRDALKYREFLKRVRAGVINWNQPLPGASSFAPFGGVKASGNNRPSGFFAVDYCAYPVASLERDDVALPEELPPGLEL